MRDLILKIRQSLSARLSLCVVGFAAIFFVVALLVMFRYARTAVKEEALAKSEAALDGMIQRIDNRLRDVEQASVNMHWNVEHHLHEPAVLQKLTRKMLDCNPSVVGCAIALDPSFCEDKDCQGVILFLFPTILAIDLIQNRNGTPYLFLWESLVGVILP